MTRIRRRGRGIRPTQLSLFDADLARPEPAHLEGLLVGPGQVVRMGGTARVSVLVTQSWRAEALLSEFNARGLGGEAVPSPAVEGTLTVRTPFKTALGPLAQRWLQGALKAPPAGLTLDGPRLRLWAIAAGVADGHGYLLALGQSDTHMWDLVGDLLAAVGLPAQLLGPRAGGPAYRIVGSRRLARLGELVGRPPIQAPPGVWPREGTP